MVKTWAVDMSPSKSPGLCGEQRGQKLRWLLPRIQGKEEDVGSPHLCFLLLWKEQSPWAEDRLEAVNVDPGFFEKLRERGLCLPV